MTLGFDTNVCVSIIVLHGQLFDYYYYSTIPLLNDTFAK
jgi:hypothetical protein